MNLCFRQRHGLPHGRRTEVQQQGCANAEEQWFGKRFHRFLLSLFDYQIAEEIENRVVLQILEFAGIEERTATDGAMLEPDVWLV
jgi:hypothetical protein